MPMTNPLDDPPAMTDHVRILVLATLAFTLIACAKSFTAPPTDGRDGAVAVADGGRAEGAADAGRSDAGLSDGGPADGGRPTRAPRLELVVGPGLWTRLERTIAADAEGNVYVTDGRTVFRIVGHVAEVFLTPEELDPRGTEGSTVWRWTTKATRGAPARRRAHLRARRPSDRRAKHAGGRVREASRASVACGHGGDVATRPGARSGWRPARAVVQPRHGRRLHGELPRRGHRRCARSVFHLPGCNASSICAGARDGSEIRELVTPDLFEAVFDRFVMFEGIAPHPSSGVLALSCDAGLFHVHEDGVTEQAG